MLCFCLVVFIYWPANGIKAYSWAVSVKIPIISKVYMQRMYNRTSAKIYWASIFLFKKRLSAQNSFLLIIKKSFSGKGFCRTHLNSHMYFQLWMSNYFQQVLSFFFCVCHMCLLKWFVILMPYGTCKNSCLCCQNRFHDSQPIHFQYKPPKL